MKGFTLIELMITVVIAALLATSATLVYCSFIEKARRADALESLLSIQLAEEKYQTYHNVYGTLSEVWQKTTTEGSYYHLSISNLSNSSYTITATGKGSQANDRQGAVFCNILSLSVKNGIETKMPSECWQDD